MAKSFSMESLNAAQRKAVQTLQGPVLILAGAGTGKTRTVTCRIAHMVDGGISPKSILAVTFTNKAALEMRERVGQMVERKAARQIMVSTFHSLCVRILREDIGRLGYKTNFTIYSGSEQSGLIRRLIVRQHKGQYSIQYYGIPSVKGTNGLPAENKSPQNPPHRSRRHD